MFLHRRVAVSHATIEAPMNTSCQSQGKPGGSFPCLPPPGPRAPAGTRTVSWHYGRGERDEASCTACCLGRGYQFRLFASARPDEVRFFASAADLLSHHAWIERQLLAAGWHLVRFTHQTDGILRASGRRVAEFTAL
jgi:hypothetical protein